MSLPELLGKWGQALGMGPRLPPVDEGRWVVLDVETSGLDPRQDALLAIAAIAIQVDWGSQRLQIAMQDSFEVVIQQPVSSSKDNILLHGIGSQRQKDGMPPPLALQAFADYCGQSPLLAFHAAFDRTMLERHARMHGLALRAPWADIEHLCAITHPQVKARALDDWMAHFGIACAQRHQAAADTLAECELLLRIWPQVLAELRKGGTGAGSGKAGSWKAVQSLADQQRWLPRNA